MSKFKFLDVKFDAQLTFKAHINNITKSSKSTLNLLRAISGTSWEAQTVAMLMVYKACILSRIDCGAQAYSCASPHLLHQHNSKQSTKNNCQSLEVEFNIMLFQYRRKLQHLKYYLKIDSLPHLVQNLMPVETRPGQCLKSNAKVNDSFATLANKIEVETGIGNIPVAMPM